LPGSESLSAAQRGRGWGPLRSNGRVRWWLRKGGVLPLADAATHLTPPTLRVGPLPLPPLRGRRGPLRPGDVRRPNMRDTRRQAVEGAKRMRLIGVDVGGTFTDLVYADTDAGSTAVHKISTTPDDPSRGVVQGLMALCDK